MNESRMVRWSIFGCAAIAVGSIVMSLVFVTTLNRQIDAGNKRTTDARLASCLSYNEDLAAKVNALNDRTQGLMRAAFAPNPGRPAATQKLIDKFVADQAEQFNAIKVEPRDCSPAGIAAFYKGGNK